MWHIERWVGPLLVLFYTDLPPISKCFTYSVCG